MSLVWDIFETDDRDETPEDADEWTCSECGEPEDLGLHEYTDDFGRIIQSWTCGRCYRRLMGGRICL